MNLYSPLTGNKVKFEKKILVSKLIEQYQKTFNINVRKYFGQNKNICIYKCLDTGYRFFYPFNISGDSKFYEHFQQYNWYYMPWKWEHEHASKYIKRNMKVLEVGCAKGDFLKKIQKNIGCKCVGLEYNETVKEYEEQQGVLIYNQSIQDYSQSHKEEFDVVCSFQVLEHISQVKEFIEAQLVCLKTDGLLIISVPNNNSFLSKSDNLLNLPPHHMGLWNKQSLSKIAEIFNLQIEKIIYEPLQSYHIEYFNQTNRDLFAQYSIIPKRIIPKLVSLVNLFSSKNYKAFTIQFVFIKKTVKK